MDFLKGLFTEPLSFEAFQKAVNEKGIKLADLSTGNYVDKDKFQKVNDSLKEAKDTITKLTNEAEELKTKGADAEAWRDKFEKLQKDIKEKDEQAEADRKAKEKADGIAARFETVVGEKKFSHDAVRADYLKKFGEALDNTDYQGKSDAEIFHALTKDDAAAFENVMAYHLEGPTNKGFGAEIDDAQARAVMGLPSVK